MPACLGLQDYCSQYPLTLWQATVNPHSARDSQTHTGKSGCLLWGHCSFLLGPGAHKVFLCPPKIFFLEGAQSFCWISRLGNLLWALELLQKCEDFFGRIVLQFVGHFLDFRDSSAGKESACNAGGPSFIPGLERSAGEGIGTHANILGLPLWLSW